MTLLSVESLTAGYGGVPVLRDVSVHVESGEIVALLGANGAGKTTLLHTIAGLNPEIRGTIAVLGQKVNGWSTHQIVRQGLSLLPENRGIFYQLTVAENLRLYQRKGGSVSTADVIEYFPALAALLERKAGLLSGGEQQMLVIARALMTNPKLLILDEATEGLAPVIRQEIWEAIHKLKDEGISILIVDKTLKELLALSDNCFILERGETVWSGIPSNLTTNIADKYLGV